MENVSTDKLGHDLRAVVVDTQELLKTAAAQTGERVEKIRAQAGEALRSARALLQEVGHSAEEQARAAAGNVNGKVHDHPWTAVGVAAVK